MCGRFNTHIHNKKSCPYSINERRVPELIPILGSQPAGEVSHKPGGRLPLLSTRPAVTLATLKRAATNFAAWVWTVCLKLLPDSVATAIWTRPFCAWVQHANHSATEPPHAQYTHTQWTTIKHDKNKGHELKRNTAYQGCHNSASTAIEIVGLSCIFTRNFVRIYWTVKRR